MKALRQKLRRRFIGWLGGVISEATAEADARRFAEFERLHRKTVMVHATGMNRAIRAATHPKENKR